ncbi:VOC family protein [Pseudarthrobacter phenanthrenivorans]|uniref:VOC family protein n=1 Tax=Pseudarthrobacter phenanthrenivorans TaxID=361575 RepID=UPI00112C31D1|nr:VOC family protein [Pseudarthrobacter phenanthrenivorans]TPV50166.1 VOC family protein [Pseudarthrobacter phenanthrenivorans]
MLRVRPIHFTSRPDTWDRLLTALGMVRTEDDGDWQVFDAGSGRLALHAVPRGAAEDGTTATAVEVGDLAEFARRTNLAADEDGTAPAELVDVDHGQACRITAPDGFTFLADKAAHFAQCADADPALAVVGVWFTPDAGSAARTLQHLGARPRPVPDQDDTADFTAKNGGVLMVRPALGSPRSGLGFEYDGALEPLQERLAAAGFQVSVTEEAFARTLHVANPDAGAGAAEHVPGTLWISGRRG